MTGGPPQTLSQDAFADHSSRHASDGRPLLSAADASALRASVRDINRHNVRSNQYLDLACAHPRHGRRSSDDDEAALPGDVVSPKLPTRPGQIQFRSHTIAPSPPLAEDPITEEPAEYNERRPQPFQPFQPFQHSPLADSSEADSLSVATDIRPAPPARSESLSSNHGHLTPSSSRSVQRKASSSSLKPISRTPSLKQAIHNNINSACSSAYPSPIISAMGDITPLPSPLLASDSPGPWRRLGVRPPSRDAPQPSAMVDSALITANGESVASALANQTKRRTYVGLKGVEAADAEGGERTHGRNRSVSEYVPDPMNIPKRQTTVSGSRPRNEIGADERQMRREPRLGATRGLVPAAQPPSPPASESSQSNDGGAPARKSKVEYFEARGRHDKKLRRWRAIKQLGEGTFSRVMLATSQVNVDDDDSPGTPGSASEPDLKTLVAVKVCEHGPRGGASEDRIEMSLKRELEIMQSIHHPSLVHLKAWNIEQSRALLVLSYCPGGDLFDLAARHREVLTPPLLRRIFAELVGAVKYLHERRIVHRDIKLESRSIFLSPPPFGCMSWQAVLVGVMSMVSVMAQLAVTSMAVIYSNVRASLPLCLSANDGKT